jgi:endonuclease IV
MNLIYLSTTFIKDNQKLSKSLNLIKKNKLTVNVELGSNHIYEKNYNYLKKYNFNFLTHNYFPPQKKEFVINIASNDNVTRKKSIFIIKKNIKFSKKIKSKLYTFHPGFLEDPIGKNQSKLNYDFVWSKKKITKNNYQIAWGHMLKSLKEIIKFSNKIKQKIAIETEGSFKKSHLLLMQRPVEFKNLYKTISPKDLGINLNLGHLNLASKAFNFSRKDFVKNIKNYIVAIEMSHNMRLEDNHLPLKKGRFWYWKILKDKAFENTPKILEVRNIQTKDLSHNLKMIINELYTK